MKKRHRKMFGSLLRSWKMCPRKIHTNAPPTLGGRVVGAFICGDGTWASLQSSEYHYCTVGVTYEVWFAGSDEPEGHVTYERVRAMLHRRGGFLRYCT